MGISGFTGSSFLKRQKSTQDQMDRKLKFKISFVISYPIFPTLQVGSLYEICENPTWNEVVLALAPIL